MKDQEYKKVGARTYVEVVCNCPYCNSFEDILDNDSIRESLGNELRCDNADVEITCSECDKIFIVETITY